MPARAHEVARRCDFSVTQGIYFQVHRKRPEIRRTHFFTYSPIHLFTCTDGGKPWPSAWAFIFALIRWPRWYPVEEAVRRGSVMRISSFASWWRMTKRNVRPKPTPCFAASSALKRTLADADAGFLSCRPRGLPRFHAHRGFFRKCRDTDSADAVEASLGEWWG
jgi:hypothetical protein